MEARQELQVQAPADVGDTALLLRQDEQEVDLARLSEVIRQTRDMIDYVNSARDGAMLVRRASATDKLVTEALKGCQMLEAEQFALRQSAAEAHLRTQRRAGELLSSMDKNPGGRPAKTGPNNGRVSKANTLAEIGISRNESQRWQQLASIPFEQFEEYVSECHSRRRELTTAGALARARRGDIDRAAAVDRPSSREGQLAKYERIKRAWSDLVWLDPAKVIAAMEPARRPRESEDADRLLAWLEQFRSILDRHLSKERTELQLSGEIATV
jgi:hypothetical protein